MIQTLLSNIKESAMKISSTKYKLETQEGSTEKSSSVYGSEYWIEKMTSGCPIFRSDLEKGVNCALAKNSQL